MDEQAGKAGSASRVKMTMWQELKSSSVVKDLKGGIKGGGFFCHFRRGYVAEGHEWYKL